jgi:hypothetical protein
MFQQIGVCGGAAIQSVSIAGRESRYRALSAKCREADGRGKGGERKPLKPLSSEPMTY